MAGKSNGYNMETDWARAPPKPGTFWEEFLKAIYNPEDGSFLGRTCKRWAIVVVFYAIFYAVLALMFWACMAGLFATLDNRRPMYTLTSSLIGDNPGVAYRPVGLSKKGEHIVIDQLEYRPASEATWNSTIEQLEEFFEPYQGHEWLTARNECLSEDKFGFPYTPCHFIKLNKIFDWKPDFYDVTALPDEMPDDLKEYIKQQPSKEQVWVSCWEVVKENVSTTTIDYPWGRGMPSSFFPYTNDPGYRAPLVAVRITPDLTVQDDAKDEVMKIKVEVRCRVWAKNIIFNKSLKEPRGYSKIELIMDMA